MYRQLFRLSLTQRELLGTGMLLELSEEWGRAEQAARTTGAPPTTASLRRKLRARREK